MIKLILVVCLDLPINIRNIDVNNIAVKNTDELASLKKLKHINMEGSNLKDEDFKFLFQLENIGTLYLRNNHLTHIDFAANLPYLYSLNFSQNKVSNIDAVKDLKALDDISMNNNLISDMSLLSASGGYRAEYNDEGMPIIFIYSGYRDLSIWMTGN